MPYDTVRPRPVVGAEGLVAEAWHWAWPRHGAPQLTGRFEKQAKRHMGSADWAAWIAVKAVVEAVVRTENAPFAKMVAYLGGEEITIDGFKGNRLYFRDWDRQLRQPADRHPQRGDRARADCGLPAPDQQHGHARLRPARQPVQAVELERMRDR